jgi:hypothetical protein
MINICISAIANEKHHPDSPLTRNEFKVEIII